MINIKLSHEYSLATLPLNQRISNILLFEDEQNFPIILVIHDNDHSSYEWYYISINENGILLTFGDIIVGKPIYSDDQEDWKLIEENRKMEEDQVVRFVTSYERPILYYDFWIQGAEIKFNERQFGTRLTRIKHVKQEQALITYLNEWLSLNLAELDGDHYKDTKELDKYLTRVHVSVGDKLRISGTNYHTLIGEDTGDMDNEKIRNHFVKVISSIL